MTDRPGWLSGLWRQEAARGQGTGQRLAPIPPSCDAECRCSRSEWLEAAEAGDAGACLCPGWLMVTLEAQANDR